jgi:Ca-activated chloride channel homolog
MGNFVLFDGFHALSNRFEEGAMIFRFESKDAFLTYLWLVPVVVFFGIFVTRRAAAKIEKQIGHRLTPFLMSSISKVKRRTKLLLEILTLVFFVIAMARPQMGSSLQEVKSEGVEIMLLVDVSKSMMAEDTKPNRLEVTKVELKRLIDRLSGDKVGLVVFAGSAFLVSPMTTDYSALKLYIDSLSTESVSTQGTEIKPALDAAVDAFKRGGVGDEEGVAVTRVILIASDGEDHDQGALNTAQKLFAQGTRIFALGVGTEQGAPVPVRDDAGYLKGYLKDKKNQIVNSQHHSDFLTKLATTAGGGYYHASSFNSVDQIKAQLEKLQKAQFESSLSTEYDERFQLFLMLGILLGLCELALGERKTTGIVWRGRLSGLGSTTALALMLWSWNAQAANILTPDVISRNNEAAESLKQKQSYQAYKDLTDLLSTAPFQPEVRMNLGLAFEMNEEFDKAIKEYLSVAGSNVDPSLKFQAFFNAARLFGEKKKIPDALQYYQEALKIDPSSVEVKTNIELLFAQGGGGGDGDDKKDQQQDDKKDPKKDKSGDKEKENPQPQPQDGKKKEKRAPPRFKSEELSEQDVKNILEELKRQEQKNRAKMMDQAPKENSNGPDW